MEENIRWSIVVNKETDISLRTFLAQHGTRKGDISKFVEEAVRWRILDRAVSETKAKNAGVPAKVLEAAIRDAVRAVRAERFKK